MTNTDTVSSTLTESQVKFILEKFFEPWTNKYPGAMNIGRSLLTKGTAVVPGENCIFVGGIGNFIECSKADDLFGCLLYKFKMESFLSSLFFHEVLEANIETLKEEQFKISTKIEDLQTVFEYGKMLRNE
jgi:hypothetical protein